MLNKMERLFVEYYVSLRDDEKACIKAGFHPSIARRKSRELLARPEILEAINLAVDDVIDRVKIDREWVLKKAKNLFERCSGEKLDAKNALSALSLIDKLVSKVDEEGRDQAVINIHLGGENSEFKIL